jgi:hypothetical protein
MCSNDFKINTTTHGQADAMGTNKEGKLRRVRACVLQFTCARHRHKKVGLRAMRKLLIKLHIPTVNCASGFRNKHKTTNGY